MSNNKLLHGAWIPLFWTTLAILCWLLPSGFDEQLGMLVQPWYWLLLAVLCNRWQHLNDSSTQRRSAQFRRRPAATRRRARRFATARHSSPRSA